MTKEEKKEAMEMLYKYREAFSLRGEVGTCPNIKVEIEVTDKSPFLYDYTMLERHTKHLLTKK